jgi:hypothetical protein
MPLGFNVWGYIGPETILPATSILAAVCGFILAFWNYLVGAVVKMVRCIFRRPSPSAAQGSAPTVARYPSAPPVP